MRVRSCSWFELVTGALIRAGFTTDGRPPAVGYLVYRWTRKGAAGLAVIEIHGNRTLRKVLPDGRIYVHKHCSVEDAVGIIGSAAIDADFPS